ncbi:MAG: efflux RND transporter periplasmic adaptor subunit [Roseobacter sp.]
MITLRPSAVLTLLVVLAASPSAAQQSTADALGPMGQKVPVASVKLLSSDLEQTGFVRRFFGRIAARETVDLSFEVGGRLVTLPVVEGETYAKNTLVAALETETFERAVRRAELALAQAERAAERAQQLAASNVASAVRAEDAETARDLAEVNLREARAALEDATLTTPFTALVASRLAANFSNIEPGQPILRLHDMSQIRVQIDVPERLFQSGIPPEAIKFTGDIAQMDSPIPLQLIEFEAQTKVIGQTFLVTLSLPDLQIPTLIPGASMTVTAQIDAAFREPGRPVPASALILDPDRNAKVMVFEPSAIDPNSGTVRAQEVELVSSTGTDLRVVGLEPGSEIVAAGVQMLKDGQNVRRYKGLSVEE